MIVQRQAGNVTHICFGALKTVQTRRPSNPAPMHPNHYSLSR